MHEGLKSEVSLLQMTNARSWGRHLIALLDNFTVCRADTKWKFTMLIQSGTDDADTKWKFTMLIHSGSLRC